ncbi:MAG: PTS fructose transporter subunit IIA [Magnetospirillum sp.]|nr:PTS fructose transporter subunit IIA [Magnetospirillum sp.]
MIGLVLVTHGRLADELVAALEHVVGPQPSVGAVCIGPEDDMEQRRNDILASVARCDDLPMLIKLASVRHTEPLADAVASAQEAGRKYINVASKLLTQDRK